MIVSVRFLSVAALAALAVAPPPVAAQAASDVAIASVPTLSVDGVGRGSGPGSPATGLASPLLTAPSDSATGTATTPRRGPTMSSASVAVRTTSSESRAPLAPMLQNRTSNRNALAMMIVGGAALLVGAVIGDDAGTFVMLGGAAVGLYGLYMFLT